MSGLLSQGYGIVPKAAMTDTDISFNARTLYGYLCSYTGKGSTVFPSRDKILHDLGWSKDKFYESLNELKDNGYISIRQIKENNRFSHNEYILEDKPLKYAECKSANSKKRKQFAAIMSEGIMSAGYGLVPYAVMTCDNLPGSGKGLYCYLTVFIPASRKDGQNPYADLQLPQILCDLDISRNTYYKIIKQLINSGFMRTSTLSDNSGRRISMIRFERVFFAETKPISQNQDTEIEPVGQNQDTAKEPKSKNQDTENDPSTKNQDTGNSPSTKNQDTGNGPNTKNQDTGNDPNTKNQDTQNQDTKKQDTQNKDTNNTSLNITSSTNTNSILNLEGRIKTVLRKQSQESLWQILWTYHPDHLEAANLLIDVVAETVCSSGGSVKIRGKDVPVAEIQKLRDLLTLAAVDEVVDRFMSHKASIRNHGEVSYKAYLLATFYDYCTQPLEGSKEAPHD